MDREELDWHLEWGVGDQRQENRRRVWVRGAGGGERVWMRVWVRVRGLVSVVWGLGSGVKSPRAPSRDHCT